MRDSRPEDSERSKVVESLDFYRLAAYERELPRQQMDEDSFSSNQSDLAAILHRMALNHHTSSLLEIL